MAVAAVSNASVTNMDSSVLFSTVPFVASTNQTIVVHVGIASASATVASVTDSLGNTYTKAGSVLAQQELDYTTEHYDKNPMFDYIVEGECWTAKSTGAVTTVTVTLTAGANFAVELESYSGVTSIGVASATAQTTSSAPTVTLTSTGANSFISAGFSSTIGLNEAATAGTLRNEAASGDQWSSVALTIGDATVAGLAAALTVTIAPVNQVTIDGAVLGTPATYAVCAVELRS